MIIFKNRIFKVSDIDQGKAYINMPYERSKELGVFSLFEKGYTEKRKKNPIVLCPGLRYADKKLKFACKVFFWKMFV